MLRVGTRTKEQLLGMCQSDKLFLPIKEKIKELWPDRWSEQCGRIFSCYALTYEKYDTPESFLYAIRALSDADRKVLQEHIDLIAVIEPAHKRAIKWKHPEKRALEHVRGYCDTCTRVIMTHLDRELFR